MPPLSNLQKSCIALAVGQALIPTNLRAATITVDAPGAPMGCTLYDAVEAANTDSVVGNCSSGAGADSIELPTNERFLLSNGGSVEGLVISSEVTIQGNNSIIQRDTATVDAKRLIDIAAGSNVTINNLALDDGRLYGGEGGGAAIRVTDSDLTLNNSSVTDSKVHDGGEGGGSFESGGAIAATGSTVTLNYVNLYRNSAGSGGAISMAGGSSLTLYRSSIERNSARYNGGAINSTAYLGVTVSESYFRRNSAGYDGGAIRSVSETTVETSTFTRNRSRGSGGAIATISGDLSINNSNFRSNSATYQGGALDASNGSSVTIDKSSLTQNSVTGSESLAPLEALSPTVSGSKSSQLPAIEKMVVPSLLGGGAIALSQSTSNDNQISNTTIANNSVRGTKYGSANLYGGGILVGDSNISIVNSTITGGEFNSGGEGGEDGAAIFAYDSAEISLQNTVITTSVDARRDSLLGGEFGITPLCGFQGGSSLDQNSNNFFSDDSCDGYSDGDAQLSRGSRYFGGTGGEFVAGADVNTSYTSYGRGTQTVSQGFQSIYKPTFDSPLINSANVTVCSGAIIGGEDQRGRPHDATCDIGSIDVTAGSIVVDNIGDDIGDEVAACTLRDALLTSYNSGGEGGESLRSGSTCTNNYDLTTIQFDSMVFPTSGETTIALNEYLPSINSIVSIEGPGSGALTLDGAGEQVMRAFNADLLISDFTVTGGSTNGRGGGIRADNSALDLNRMVVSGNNAQRGGGGMSMANSLVTITDTTISENQIGGGSQGGEGAGILSKYNTELSLESSTVSGNYVGISGGTSTLQGGGIGTRSGAFTTIRNSTISGNNAYNGGGIYVAGGEFVSYNSTISDNQSANQGGGIFAVSGGEFLALNSIVSGNASDLLGAEIAVDSGAALFYGSLLGDSSNTYSEAVFSTSSLSISNSPNFLATSDSSMGAPNPNATALEDIIDPLGDNGGFTLTHLPDTRGPAIDGGEQQLCGGESIFPELTYDQRGFRRTDGRCDIGSVEYLQDACFVIPTANDKIVSFCL